MLPTNHVSVLCMELYVSGESHAQYAYMIGSRAQPHGAPKPCKYFSSQWQFSLRWLLTIPNSASVLAICWMKLQWMKFVSGRRGISSGGRDPCRRRQTLTCRQCSSRGRQRIEGGGDSHFDGGDENRSGGRYGEIKMVMRSQRKRMVAEQAQPCRILLFFIILFFFFYFFLPSLQLSSLSHLPSISCTLSCHLFTRALT